MRRTDLQGTTPAAYREKLRRDRELTPEERLRKTDELIVDILEMRRKLAGDSEKLLGVDGLLGKPSPIAPKEEDPFA